MKKFFVLTLFFISTAMVFSTNLNSHLQLSYNGKQSSYISDADFSAADWINKNYLKQKVFLVSDPSTQAVFEALTDVNTQGGAFPQENTVKLIGSLAWEKSPSVIYKTIKKIHDRLIDQDKKDITIFIMGGRYFRWQKFDWDCKLNYACQSWLPLKIKAADQLLIKKLSDSNYFKVVYQNEENVILELVK